MGRVIVCRKNFFITITVNNVGSKTWFKSVFINIATSCLFFSMHLGLLAVKKNIPGGK